MRYLDPRRDLVLRPARYVKPDSELQQFQNEIGRFGSFELQLDVTDEKQAADWRRLIVAHKQSVDRRAERHGAKAEIVAAASIHQQAWWEEIQAQKRRANERAAEALWQQPVAIETPDRSEEFYERLAKGELKAWQACDSERSREWRVSQGYPVTIRKSQ